MSGDRAVALDAAAVLAAGVAACAFAGSPRLMAGVVAAAYAARMAAWARLPREERPHGLGVEAALLAGCAALGAFNDWNTVVRHGVYAYGVPSDLEQLSSIPAWMLAYWGLILRFVATLGGWPRLGPSARDQGLGLRAGAPRVAVSLALVLATRQAIYRLWDDPLLSWLPFAAALGVHALALGWGPRERRLAALAAVLGPLAEAALIGVGGLHRYALGWLGGVPLWILLWWVLATLVWGELARDVAAWAAAAGPAGQRAAANSRPSSIG